MDRTTLGPFRLLDRLGRGGMAEVWRAVHEQDRVQVAVKVLTGDRARRPRNRRQFRQEIRAVAKLDHPHIVGVHDAGEVTVDEAAAGAGWLEEGMPYLVMDLLPSGSLWSYRGRLAWPDLRALLLRLLDALAHAHARGVIHRDLKLTNVMLSAERRPILTDFGLAHLRDSDAVHLRAGTPTYMAPEQFLDRWRDFGPWTDLYGLGCLAWTLATGRPPFLEQVWEGTRDAHLHGELPPFEPIQPVADGFVPWLGALLDKDPAARTQRAADAAWALEQLDEGPVAPEVGDLPVTPDDTVETQAVADVSTLDFGEPTDDGFDLGATIGRRDRPPPPPTDWRRADSVRRLHLRGTGLGLLAHRAIPTVGRAVERDALWSSLVALHRDRRAQVLVLQGPAGTGKSHLARWLGRRAHEVGAAHVLRVEHTPGGVVGAGLGGMLSEHLVLDDLQGDELRLRVFEAGRSWGTVDPGDLTRLAELAGGASSRPPERAAALARHLAAVGSRRPLVLVVDDAQRGIDALVFVRWLLERRDALRVPVLVLLVAEDEGLARAAAAADLVRTILEAPGARAIRIEPLSDAEQLRLVSEWLGLEGELARRVVRRTGGHPGFALSLLHDWTARRVLERAESGFRLRDEAEVRLPNQLHELWGAHLDVALMGYGESVRHGLEVAAVMGTRVRSGDWQRAAAAAGVHPSLDAVERLIEGRLAVGAVVTTEWRFAHGMVRESLLRRADEGGRLARWHQAVLQALAAELDLERRARHLLGCGRIRAGVEALLAAAEAHEEAGAPHRVLDLCEQAERVWGPVRSRTLQRAGGLRRARALLTLGRLDEAEAAARDALGADDGAGSTTELRLVLAHVARRRGHLAAAGDALRDLAHELRRRDEPRALADALRTLGRVLYERGDVEQATSALAEARGTSARLGDLPGWAESSSWMADALVELGRLDAAEALVAEVLTRWEDLPTTQVAVLLDARARIALRRGDRAAAEGACEESLALLEHVGSLDAVVPRLHLASVQALDGRYADAWRLGERCLQEVVRQGRQPLELSVRAVMLLAAHGMGNAPAAAEHLDRVVELARRGTTGPAETYALLGLAVRALAESGDEVPSQRLRRVVVDWAFTRGRRHKAEIAALVGLE